MTKRQYYVALAVLAASGLLGGALATWLPGRAAWAQGEGAAKELRAESFVVVDEAGKTRAALGSTEAKDTRTGATIKYPISTITLFGQAGRALWQAP